MVPRDWTTSSLSAIFLEFIENWVLMEKQKKWQFFLILAVLVLTIYNILPTLFYYSKPLKNPISEQQAEEIRSSIVQRVADLETDAKDWISSFSSTLGLKPQAIQSRGHNLV